MRNLWKAGSFILAEVPMHICKAEKRRFPSEVHATPTYQDNASRNENEDSRYEEVSQGRWMIQHISLYYVITSIEGGKMTVNSIEETGCNFQLNSVFLCSVSRVLGLRIYFRRAFFQLLKVKKLLKINRNTTRLFKIAPISLLNFDWFQER
jgi:hypothetical protein